MEEETKQSSLPKKTKIAAWWIVIIGVIILVVWINWLVKPLLLGYPTENVSPIRIFIVISAPLFLSLFLFVLSFYLFKKKKWAWIVLIVTFPIPAILGGMAFYSGVGIGLSHGYSIKDFLGDMGFYFSAFLASFFVPFILLFLDRKKFFKIAT